jgi:hypothetical protein
MVGITHCILLSLIWFHVHKLVWEADHVILMDVSCSWVHHTLGMQHSSYILHGPVQGEY